MLSSLAMIFAKKKKEHTKFRLKFVALKKQQTTGAYFFQMGKFPQK